VASTPADAPAPDPAQSDQPRSHQSVGRRLRDGRGLRDLRRRIPWGRRHHDLGRRFRSRCFRRAARRGQQGWRQRRRPRWRARRCDRRHFRGHSGRRQWRRSRRRGRWGRWRRARRNGRRRSRRRPRRGGRRRRGRRRWRCAWRRTWRSSRRRSWRRSRWRHRRRRNRRRARRRRRRRRNWRRCGGRRGRRAWRRGGRGSGGARPRRGQETSARGRRRQPDAARTHRNVERRERRGRHHRRQRRFLFRFGRFQGRSAKRGFLPRFRLELRRVQNYLSRLLRAHRSLGSFLDLVAAPRPDGCPAIGDHLLAGVEPHRLAREKHAVLDPVGDIGEPRLPQCFHAGPLRIESRVVTRDDRIPEHGLGHFLRARHTAGNNRVGIDQARRRTCLLLQQTPEIALERVRRGNRRLPAAMLPDGDHSRRCRQQEAGKNRWRPRASGVAVMDNPSRWPSVVDPDFQALRLEC